MSHWHNVYKISSNSSPHEKNQLDGESGVESFPQSKRLSLLSGNLPIEYETKLRHFLTPRINKMSDITSSIQGFDSIKTNNDGYLIPDVPTQLYYKIINSNGGIIEVDSVTEKIPEVVQFVVCFIVAASCGLELFQEDLDKYCLELSPYLDKCMESTDISDYLKFIDTWYDSNICFVQRCLDYFSCQLAVLMCAGFCGDSIVIGHNAPLECRTDIQRFLACCSVSPLFMDSSTELVASCSSSSMQDMVSLSHGETVHITYEEEGIFLIQATKSTTFCQECVEHLQNVNAPNPLLMREVLENYKLRSIQHMNSFTRLLKEAERNYYSLYKTFLFLVSCGNGLVLLHNTKLHNSILGSGCTSSKQVLDILEIFLDSLGGFGSLDTVDNRNMLKLKMNASGSSGIGKYYVRK